jgi:hypothetical protein
MWTPVSLPTVTRVGSPPAAKSGKGVRSPLTWRITGDEVGPLKLGMSEAAIRRIAIRHGLHMERVRGPGVEFSGKGPKGEAWGHWKKPSWKLILFQDARKLLVVYYDEEDKRHSPIEVIDPHIRTWEGARVGTRFRTLARLYRRGTVSKDAAGLSLYFDDPRVMGTDFNLENGAAARLPEEPVNRPLKRQTRDKAERKREEEAWQRKAWHQLRRANPQVTSIIIAGE